MDGQILDEVRYSIYMALRIFVVTLIRDLSGERKWEEKELGLGDDLRLILGLGVVKTNHRAFCLSNQTMVTS